MPFSLSPPLLAEALLSRLSPAWEYWDEDLDPLTDALRREVEAGLVREDLGLSRALWLLDRLLPADTGPLFADWLARGGGETAAYAWGRRLVGEERERLFDLPGATFEATHSALQAAFCELHREDPSALLGWWSRCRRAGHDPYRHYMLLPLREYVARTPDRTARAEGLRGLIRAYAPGGEHGATMEAQEIREVALQHLLTDVARAFPPPTELPSEEPEEASLCFLDQLYEGGHGEIADLCKLHREERPLGQLEPLALRWWVERHDGSSWELLVDDVALLEERGPYLALRRMSQIVPPDRPDAWGHALRIGQRGLYPLQYFAAWLARDLRDLLLPEFSSPDREWGESAFLAYLHRVPEPVALSLLGSGELRAWQAPVLDRFLFAPRAVRPGPVLYDIQDSEADFRLHDPFNARSF
jgi:hypothetical protein